MSALKSSVRARRRVGSPGHRHPVLAPRQPQSPWAGTHPLRTTHCQHFKEPTPHGFRAAAKTKNLILVWQGQPFAPAYSASCGGRTKTAAAIGWRDEETYPYFPVDCPICQRDEQPWTRRFVGYDAATLRDIS